MQVVKISNKITHGENFVILSKNEYDNMKNKLKELSIVVQKIKKGETELRNGKTITNKRLKDFI